MAQKSFHRTDRVSAQLRRELGTLVHAFVREHGLASSRVSDVEVTRDMAHAKVDAKQLGFKINDSVTTKTGDTETLVLRGSWDIAESGKLPLSYAAALSAVSKAVTEQEVLSIVFVLEWGGE